MNEGVDSEALASAQHLVHQLILCCLKVRRLPVEIRPTESDPDWVGSANELPALYSRAFAAAEPVLPVVYQAIDSANVATFSGRSATSGTQLVFRLAREILRCLASAKELRNPPDSEPFTVDDHPMLLEAMNHCVDSRNAEWEQLSSQVQVEFLNAENFRQENERHDVGETNPKFGQLASHAVDFASVDWFGMAYEFTPNQAACVKVLWEHWEKSSPAVGGDAIVISVDVNSPFRIVFRKHPSWGTMIIPAATRGRFRLQTPPG